MELVHQDDRSSVIFLGNLPDGFKEHVMKKFFLQFGEVIRLFVPKKKVPRSGFLLIG
jgi:RNA recognition motif-containing protein